MAFSLRCFSIKNLTNLYKGVGKTAASAALRAKNLMSAESLTAEGAKAASKNMVNFGKLANL